MSKLRWGILGTGNIARQFASGITASQRSKIAAVGSRHEASARAFAEKYRIPAVYGGYEAALADPNVDAVYVSLPNSLHWQWTIKALAAGKHVLCEKPLAANAAQAEEMFDVAARTGRLLAEAFMYRAHPLTLAVQRKIAEGAIGPVRLIRSSFCYSTRNIEGNIRFRADLAGGALMDIGCYCISFSRMIAGQEPSAVQVSGRLHPSGVDELAVGTMAFPDGMLASFTCGMTVQADNTAYVCGSDGYIEIPVPWKPPASGAQFTVACMAPPKMDGGKAVGPPPRETFTIDAGTDVYAVEADHFAASVLDGAPLLCGRDDTLGNMRVLDEARRQLGLEIGPFKAANLE